MQKSDISQIIEIIKKATKVDKIGARGGRITGYTKEGKPIYEKEKPSTKKEIKREEIPGIPHRLSLDFEVGGKSYNVDIPVEARNLNHAREKMWDAVKILEKKFGETIKVSRSKVTKEPLIKKALSQLELGTKIEMEHVETIKKIIKDIKSKKQKLPKEYAKEIAKDHLKELKDYYSRLQEMEKQGKETKIKKSEFSDIINILKRK